MNDEEFLGPPQEARGLAAVLLEDDGAGAGHVGVRLGGVEIFGTALTNIYLQEESKTGRNLTPGNIFKSNNLCRILKFHSEFLDPYKSESNNANDSKKEDLDQLFGI